MKELFSKILNNFWGNVLITNRTPSQIFGRFLNKPLSEDQFLLKYNVDLT